MSPDLSLEKGLLKHEEKKVKKKKCRVISLVRIRYLSCFEEDNCSIIVQSRTKNKKRTNIMKEKI